MSESTALDLFRLEDRVAVITGGSKGLGRSIAMSFAQAGAVTVIVSRSQADCDRVAGEITDATGRESVGIETDVSNESAVDAMFATLSGRFNRVDVLVNSAGINIRHPVEDFPVEDFRKVIDINLGGTFLCCRAAARLMKPARFGSVVNVGSTLGATGLAERSAYCSTKGGVLAMTRSLAKEWAPHGVRCNALCPGPFLTELNESIAKDEAKVRVILDRVPMNRWAELHEIQGAALFLASDASSYVTGSALYVDGGWTC